LTSAAGAIAFAVEGVTVKPRTIPFAKCGTLSGVSTKQISA
jgi:hypothetical protein